MLEIKKVTIDKLHLDKEKVAENVKLMHMSPPCDPQGGNCIPTAPCYPAKP